MLVPGQMPLNRRWLVRAKLWRLILLQVGPPAAHAHRPLTHWRPASQPPLPLNSRDASPLCCQTPEGYFDCSDGLALALNAHVEDDDDSNDCPLTCQVEAIRSSMPPLEFLAGADGLDADAVAALTLRVWVRALENGAPLHSPPWCSSR